VDCKKRELLGNFKNKGREWQAGGEDTVVNVYDFLSLADGKAIPYGVYDLVHNRGEVLVGIDHDTAEFAVESIRRWWQQSGKELYPGKNHVLITADGGGSNGARNRLWKKKLQELANEEHLSITVAHYPPATSKWNKIEHRLFSFISINWRAKTLTSLEVVLELISHTSTQQGLTVTALKDSNIYPTGLKVTDEELTAHDQDQSRISFGALADTYGIADEPDIIPGTDEHNAFQILRIIPKGNDFIETEARVYWPGMATPIDPNLIVRGLRLAAADPTKQ